MIQIVDIKIEDCCMVDRYLAQSLSLRKGDTCVVHTDRGTELGRVVHILDRDKVDQNHSGFRKVVRVANQRDLSQFDKKRYREEKARTVCQQLIEKHKLVMKLTRVEYVFDSSKVIFYYTADGRVDFRSLVKDLASALKTRIEMRQIGVRDEAKLLGGVGCCGLPLCCSTWLHQFHTVSIKVAKRQCLNLNPARLSGLCGRLMCCLMYEKNNPQEGPTSPDEEIQEISEDDAAAMS